MRSSSTLLDPEALRRWRGPAEQRRSRELTRRHRQGKKTDCSANSGVSAVLLFKQLRWRSSRSWSMVELRRLTYPRLEADLLQVVAGIGKVDERVDDSKGRLLYPMKRGLHTIMCQRVPRRWHSMHEYYGRLSHVDRNSHHGHERQERTCHASFLRTRLLRGESLYQTAILMSLVVYLIVVNCFVPSTVGQREVGGVRQCCTLLRCGMYIQFTRRLISSLL